MIAVTRLSQQEQMNYLLSVHMILIINILLMHIVQFQNMLPRDVFMIILQTISSILSRFSDGPQRLHLVSKLFSQSLYCMTLCTLYQMLN